MEIDSCPTNSRSSIDTQPRWLHPRKSHDADSIRPDSRLTVPQSDFVPPLRLVELQYPSFVCVRPHKRSAVTPAHAPLACGQLSSPPQDSTTLANCPTPRRPADHKNARSRSGISSRVSHRTSASICSQPENSGSWPKYGSCIPMSTRNV